MIKRLLLAVDDSPDALAAARLAVELAGQLGGELRVVHIYADHLLDAALEAASGRAAVVRRDQSADAVLARVEAMGDAAGVTVQTEVLGGEPGAAILRVARDWAADLVVVGRSARPTRGETYVGAQTRHVLEFAEQPVLVVPPRGR